MNYQTFYNIQSVQTTKYTLILSPEHLTLSFTSAVTEEAQKPNARL